MTDLTTLNPWATLYILGAFGWLTVVMFVAIGRPHQFGIWMDDIQRTTNLSYRQSMAAIAILYSVLWPLVVILAAAMIARGRR